MRGPRPGSSFSQGESDNRKKRFLFPRPPEIEEQCGLGVSSVRPPTWGPSRTQKRPWAREKAACTLHRDAPCTSR